ncbi:unnamed protein product [Heligmosomoides polygyrus]|uniref:PPM-type phosphatase domain-containing protein n=1 Tax=Heligmosomoides polygyrus TaxID=6339 RepID=A0A183FI83_HELPZ|nr:unnamed protein product [Heligmosomoides polygyrus]
MWNPDPSTWCPLVVLHHMALRFSGHQLYRPIGIGIKKLRGCRIDMEHVETPKSSWPERPLLPHLGFLQTIFPDCLHPGCESQGFACRLTGKHGKDPELTDLPEDIVFFVTDFLMDALGLGDPDIDMHDPGRPTEPVSFHVSSAATQVFHSCINPDHCTGSGIRSAAMTRIENHGSELSVIGVGSDVCYAVTIVAAGDQNGLLSLLTSGP